MDGGNQSTNDLSPWGGNGEVAESGVPYMNSTHLCLELLLQQTLELRWHIFSVKTSPEAPIMEK